MKTLVITNGVIESMDYIAYLVEQHEMILCADGAVRYLRSIQKLPSYVIGDLDSIKDEDLRWVKDHDVPIIKYDSKKNYTDTELAIRYALQQGARIITLTGTLGGRLDHSLGNIYLLVLIADQGCDGIIVENNTEVRLISKQVSLNWKIGETISFVPISKIVEEVTLLGFEYPLHKETLYLGHTRSISNTVVASNQMVNVGSGMLLAIRNK